MALSTSSLGINTRPSLLTVAPSFLSKSTASGRRIEIPTPLEGLVHFHGFG